MECKIFLFFNMLDIKLSLEGSHNTFTIFITKQNFSKSKFLEFENKIILIQ